ncbi:MAG: N-acetyl-gamma-glutamyl-phosphate reductase [Actinomycetota bacterium]
MNNQRVGVLGASGYSGAELLRYLGSHPSFEVVWATAKQNAGRTVGDVFGQLVGFADLILAPTDVGEAPELDLAFLALPHGEAAATGRALVGKGTRVVDLSADWRLGDPRAYDEWYGWAHPAPSELGNWVYGLPELHRDRIAGAHATANPGCYPTAAILALAPALQAGALDPGGIVIDAASGVSGAGRKVTEDYLFSELDASYAAYRVGCHQHTPEIEQELSSSAGTDISVTFVPHLVPMARGLLATCYARMNADVDAVRNALATAYKEEPFVHVLPAGRQPATKQVSGSNHVLIAVEADERTATAVITCAIDNLGKGAAGQAVQNANLMLGLDERAGLAATGVFP